MTFAAEVARKTAASAEEPGKHRRINMSLNCNRSWCETNLPVLNRIVEMGFEEIRYLAHNTSIRNLAGIVRDGALLTEYDVWRRKKRAGTSAFQLSDAFPGVYMSWHLGGERVSLFFGAVALIFGRDLVRRQRNFHLNLADKNGYLIEQGTFFQGDEAVPSLAAAREFMLKHGDPIAQYAHNEVVFHDSVPFGLCEAILVAGGGEKLAEVKAMLPPDLAAKVRRIGEEWMPTRAVTTKRPDLLDTTSPPCQVFYSDVRYSGIPTALPRFDASGAVQARPRYRSGVRFVREIAKRAGVDAMTVARLGTSEKIEAFMEKKGVYLRAFLDSGRR